MPCDTYRLPTQTITERKEEIRGAVARLSELIGEGRVTPKVGPQGAIAFQGWSEADRRRVTDACAYRQLMSKGTATARLAILKAERLAGRTVDKQVVGHGTHSHDGGRTWHGHKG